MKKESFVCQRNQFVKSAATQSMTALADAHTAAKQLSANAASERKLQPADKPSNSKIGCVGDNQI